MTPNYQDKNKNGTKITSIIDEHRFPLYLRVDPSNVHDAKIFKSAICDLDELQNLGEKITIVGDKGYIINIENFKKKRILKRNIKLIFPPRKNQKRKSSNKERKALKKRPIIENFFSSMKQFKKIDKRSGSRGQEIREKS